MGFAMLQRRRNEGPVAEPVVETVAQPVAVPTEDVTVPKKARTKKEE